MEPVIEADLSNAVVVDDEDAPLPEAHGDFIDEPGDPDGD